MKKYSILALALALCGALLVGCGCSMGGNVDTTTVPSSTPAARETTAATTAPTTAATTAPTTQATTNPTDAFGDTSETAGENGVVAPDSTDTTEGTNNERTRSNHRTPPMG